MKGNGVPGKNLKEFFVIFTPHKGQKMPKLPNKISVFGHKKLRQIFMAKDQSVE